MTVDNSGPSNSITAPVPATIYNGPNDTWATAWSGTSRVRLRLRAAPCRSQSVQYAVKNNGDNILERHELLEPQPGSVDRDRDLVLERQLPRQPTSPQPAEAEAPTR